MLASLKAFYAKYERFIIPAALILGLLPDIFFFAFVSFDATIITLAFYLILAGLSIVIINLYDNGHLRLAALLALHFTFGALFSSFVLFYSFSGSLLASWPFIATLVFLVAANEVFNKYNTRPDIHLSVYFFALFSFFNLAIPYLIRDLGPKVFVGSGILSVAIAGLFIWILCIYIPRVNKVKEVVSGSIAIIFVAMTVFYLTNLIPPIPLSLRDVGVYYHAERVDSEYKLIGRETELFEKLNIFSDKFLAYKSAEAYVFSSIFAPPGMGIEVLHEWQFHDPQLGWATRSVISFPITGGRAEGFRGFSKVSTIQPGRWRVNVKTSRGQVIGRYRFTVVETDAQPAYIIGTK